MDEISELLRKLTPESGTESRLYLDRSAPPGLPSRSQRLQGAQAEPCEQCGGAGFLLDDLPLGHPDYGTPVPCKCKLEERSQRRRSRFQGVNELDALARFTFESFNMESSELSPATRKDLARAYDKATTFADEPQGWLLFTGRFGCGKTHLAAAIANRRLDNGQAAIFVVVPDLLDHLRMTFGPNSEASYDELFDEVRRAELLILDDLGAQSATPWAQEKLFQILNHRYNGRLPTVLTTNQRMEELDQRLRSRLRHLALVDHIHISAPDYRISDKLEQDYPSTLQFYRTMNFEKFSLQRKNTTADDLSSLRRAREAAEQYAQNPTGWFVLMGPSGVGKSHLAAAIAHAQEFVGLHQVKFVVVPDLLDHLRATYSPQSPVSYDRRFDDLKRTPMLVLDDLGTESATPWAKEKLFQLLNYRYTAMLPTIITTRFGRRDLVPWLSTRIHDTDRCQVLELRASSYRGSTDQAGQRASSVRREEPDPNVWRE